MVIDIMAEKRRRRPVFPMYFAERSVSAAAIVSRESSVMLRDSSMKQEGGSEP
jgi:hypothetical protein